MGANSQQVFAKGNSHIVILLFQAHSLCGPGKLLVERVIRVHITLPTEQILHTDTCSLAHTRALPRVIE